ncbi:MAG: hypothetical protein AAFY41_04905 [Bacteroidota bacterium]
MRNICLSALLFSITILKANAQWIGTTANSTIYGRFSTIYPTIGQGYFALKTNNADEQSGGLTIQYLNQGNLTDGFSLNYQGNVGIGTTNPGAKLDINGHLRVKGSGNGSVGQGDGYTHFAHPDGNNYIRGNTFVHSDGFYVNSSIRFSGARNGGAGNGDGYTHFAHSDGNNYIRGNTYIQTNGFISLNGKVGIGTYDFSGNHKLRVEGSIGAREIKVEASGWSDFVFEKDYDLRTLEEVEQHIAEKGHLPEIPSEAVSHSFLRG